MDYTIIVSTYISGLEQDVTSWLNSGHDWRLQGGIFIVLDPSTNELMYYQALVKG